MGDFISMAVEDCSPSPTTGAACAAGALGFVGALARVGGASTQASITCSDLGSTGEAPTISYGVDGVACGFSITFSIMWMMHGAMSIVKSVATCKLHAKESCAKDILFAIGGISMGAGEIADAVSSCSSTEELGAACAGDVLMAVGSTAWLGGSAVVMNQECGPHAPAPAPRPSPPPAHKFGNSRDGTLGHDRSSDLLDHVRSLNILDHV
jgi:hypothetical protein